MATQILMKIALAYIFTKHFNSVIWKEIHCLPETILSFLKKAEIHVYGTLSSQYIQELSNTLGEEAPVILSAGPHNIYTV